MIVAFATATSARTAQSGWRRVSRVSRSSPWSTHQRRNGSGERQTVTDDRAPAVDRVEVPSPVLSCELLVGRATPNAIVAVDGSVREVDAIVVATGFHVTDSPTNERIIGRGGHSLAHTWRRAGAQAYKGSTVHGFPNLFVMTGPGTGSGHTSAVFMIDSQLNYLRDLIRTTTSRGIATVEVRRDVQSAYNADIQRGLRNSVWGSADARVGTETGSAGSPPCGRASLSVSARRPAPSTSTPTTRCTHATCPPPLTSTRPRHDLVSVGVSGLDASLCQEGVCGRL
jgi:hypothetical protein